jgi:DNA (cytosine-5)-methyltransferase 1
MTLTVGSLFSGIGGFDLGLERAGMKVIWQSEIDTFASKVLKKHWPDVPNLGDITKVDWSKIERPDVICGGYPCQPFSTAGKRGGANDPRHLWPAMHNAICVLRPRYALMENVRGHLSLGFNRVLGDLAEIGYDAEWQVIPAAAVGAPHKRERVFIVAYPNDERQSSRIKKTKPKFNGRSFNEATSQPTSPNNTRIQTDAAMADTKGKQSNGRQPTSNNPQSRKKGLQQQIGTSNTNVADTPSSTSGSTKSYGLCPRVWQTTELRESSSTSRAVSNWWEVEPDVGRVANGIPNRVDRLKGLGNAIVPQVAELVGALVVEHSQN